MHELIGRVSLEELAAFFVFAEEIFFSAASKRVGRFGSFLAGGFCQLDKRLGVSLLSRTTRRIALTEIGNAYYARVRALIDELDNASVEASNLAASPQGLLRISLPSTFGKLWIAPLLANFISKFPRIKLDTRYSDRLVDLVAEGFDVAIRVGALRDSTLTVKRIASFKYMLVASPHFVAKNGEPTSPEELSKFPCLGFTNRFEWELVKGRQKKTLRPEGPLIADSSEALLIATIDGAGIALIADWLAGPAIRNGKLVEILSDWQGAGEGGVYAIMPPGKLLPAKTRLFVDEITESVRNGWYKA